MAPVWGDSFIFQTGTLWRVKSDAINNDKGVSQDHPGGQVEGHCDHCLHSTTYIMTLNEQIHELVRE